MARANGKRSARNPQIAHDAPTARNISLFDEDGGNEYAQMVDSGHRIDPRTRRILIAAVVVVALYAVAVIVPKDLINSTLHNGGWASGYTFSWFVSDLQSNINGIVAALSGNDAGVNYSSTMFRYIMIPIAGAGLALCGAIYQGSFRNALVSPSTMGVMSGASLGVIVWVMLFVNDEATNVPWAGNANSMLARAQASGDWGSYIATMYGYSIFTFVGCAIVAGAVLITMALSKRNSTSGLMIIVMGQVFGGIVGAVSSAVRYFLSESDELYSKLQVLNQVSVQSFFRTYTWVDVLAVGVPAIILVVVVLRYNQRLMVLSLGNEEARTLGVDSKRTQIVLVATSTLLMAVIVSFCGTIGFVGFLVPHLARRMVGPNFKHLLPASMVLGAVFVLAAYLLVAMLLGPDYENMAGMYISIGGSIVFLVQALRGGSARGGVASGFQR